MPLPRECLVKQIALLLAALPVWTCHCADDVVLGAIRWDCWYGTSDVDGAYVTQNLADPRFQYRLPFYATATAGNISIDGNSSSVMGQELAFAHNFNISFWAFVTYTPATPLSYGLLQYLAHPLRALVNFALIIEAPRLESGEIPVDRIVGYFALDCYQRVTAARRPLLFVLTPTIATKAALAAVVAGTVAAGLPAPYVCVLTYGPPASQKALVDALGADAVSQYVVFADDWASPGQASAYAHSATAEQAYWQGAVDAGADIVATVLAGWDPRPREIYPVPWSQTFPAGCNATSLCWVEDPQLAELSAQTQAAVAFVRANRAAAPSGAVLISAWDEMDEGHWIVPSLAAGPAKLAAVQAGYTAALVAAFRDQPPSSPPRRDSKQKYTT